MAKGDLCKVIIRDDFNNVLIIQRKSKKGEINPWTLVTKELKGRESEEKGAHRAVREDLKTIVFDLEKIKEDKIGENMLLVYVGSVKERVSSNDNVENLQWVNVQKIEEYDVDKEDKEILQSFLNVKW